MRRFILTSTFVTAAALVAAACTPASEAEETARGAEAPADRTSGQSGLNEPALPHEGQRYWLARRQLMNQGYEPMPVADADVVTVCVAEMEAGESIAGDCPGETMVLPEVEACAGTGMANCRTNWRRLETGQHLIVFTTGEPQPGVVSGLEWSDAPALPTRTAEEACRQIVERHFGQSGDAVAFEGSNISWRAPVDGGRMHFACAVNGDRVTLTRDGQVQTFSLNQTAANPAQEEAH